MLMIFLLMYIIMSADKNEIYWKWMLWIKKRFNKGYKKGLKPSGVYLRHGSSTIQTFDEIIRKMIFEYASLRFEKMISKNQDLTFEYLEKKFKDNHLTFGKNKYKLLNIINEENKYTNLGLLLSD